MNDAQQLHARLQGLSERLIATLDLEGVTGPLAVTALTMALASVLMTIADSRIQANRGADICAKHLREYIEEGWLWRARRG